MFRKNEFVLIGKVVATHGIRGQLRVVPYSGNAESIHSQKSIILKGLHGESDVFAVANSVSHGKKVLITLESLDDINKVNHLVGRDIYVTRDQLPVLPEGEYYWFDLIGLQVVTVQGELLGELCDILETGSNDVYMVRSGEKEYLIPAVDDVVTDINIVTGTMLVNPPDGLLDL
jgi:16S rRNA processing protein RimM